MLRIGGGGVYNVNKMALCECICVEPMHGCDCSFCEFINMLPSRAQRIIQLKRWRYSVKRVGYRLNKGVPPMFHFSGTYDSHKQYKLYQAIHIILQVTCFSVTLLHLYFQCLTSYRQNTHIEIIYSMRASIASEENIKISPFQTCYINQLKCPVRGEHFVIFRWNCQILAKKMACIGHFCLELLVFTYQGAHGGQKLGLPPLKFSLGGGATALSAPPPPPRFRRLCSTMLSFEENSDGTFSQWRFYVLYFAHAKVKKKKKKDPSILKFDPLNHAVYTFRWNRPNTYFFGKVP